MKKTVKLILSLLSIFLFIGCAGSPTASKPDAKPTIYIKSHTAEKFKDVTEATAMWNGLSWYLIKDKQYMRCDMTEEVMVTLVHYDFDIVIQEEGADYTMETTLLSCGSGYGAYIKNRSELPLEEKALYKDFMKWVDETDSSKLPKTAKEIASLIKNNDPEGFERFHKEAYIWLYGNKFGDTEYWQYKMRDDKKYIEKTKGIALPGKYANMPDKDKKILEELGRKFKATLDADTSFYTGSHMASGGFGMMSTYGSSGASGAIGGAGAAIGILMMFGGVSEPDVRNQFKITNNRTGKSWSKEVRTTIPGQGWRENINKPIDDWFVDEIPWSDLE
jgi:hypothetical protein